MTQLLSKLIDRGTLRSPAVARAMSQVDRGAFVAPEWASSSRAYEDHPLPIGYGQTISAPHMHATALELLSPQLRPGARVLDVGSAGSGYLTACFGMMVHPGGRVRGVEVVPELAARSLESLRQVVPQLLQDETISIESGNVLSGERPPFDAIHVGAAAEELPQDLVAKLAPGGRMVIPVGPHYGIQVLTVVDKAPFDTAAALGGAGRQWAGLEPHGPRAVQGPGEEGGVGEGAEWGGGIRVTKLMDVGYVPLMPRHGGAGEAGGHAE
ncbi:hypothetical protein VOLCADRAFT_67902 [Volvox carteri f. nagariensis]|uniref:protein-L-isoaspartate(D-aspartate) O-methyltransferase n=1 Tax=Volvox carteri f. nagariensis TaxID=3068 RepID=D8UEZ5_VOLCA|nr:uncharacterized protein VOLCADRAFT_67902 [Volvox carteri f. nagariensis]EFJ41680.1 hypothetical protein VOLCADRAFT_67902 [Volvox carteri f. nagariensis]|eukprot:XP_002957182.1 hypothetical protein VOLCADRAFT_67902 [Volvox carteri f. nagariensis]